MPVYQFQLSAFLRGKPVSVVPSAGGSVVASGVLDGDASFSADLPVGDYEASASDGRYSYRSAGVVAQGDPDRLAGVDASEILTVTAANSTFAALGRKGRTVILGDGSFPSGTGNDVTDALQATADALGGSGTIILPPGFEGTVSAPINLGGVSLFGFDPHSTILHANPATANADWIVGERNNDTGMIWAFNADDWFVQGIGLDLHGAYCSAVTAYGGSRIRYQNVHARNGKKAMLQFAGNYIAGQLPVLDSWMVDCYVEKSLWGLVFDGAVRNSGIRGCIAKDSVLSGISIDPGEAATVDEQWGALTIADNIIDTQIVRPAEWSDDPSALQPITGGIRITSGETLTTGVHIANVTGNLVRNWTGPMGMLVAGVYANVTGNTIQNESGFGRVPTGIELRPKDGTTVTNNLIINATDAIKEVGFQRGTVAFNRFQDCTNKISRSSEGPGVAHLFNQRNGDAGLYVETSDTLNNTAPVVQAGTAYTLAITDTGRTVETTNAGAVTVTIPTASSVAFPTGTVINVFQAGAGQVTIAPAAGVTLRALNGTKTAAQYATVRLRKRSLNEWAIDGENVA